MVLSLKVLSIGMPKTPHVGPHTSLANLEAINQSMGAGGREAALWARVALINMAIAA